MNTTAENQRWSGCATAAYARERKTTVRIKHNEKIRKLEKLVTWIIGNHKKDKQHTCLPNIICLHGVVPTHSTPSITTCCYSGLNGGLGSVAL